MNTHELILLSPYRYPGQNALTLSDEDMACWLNAYTALWHPGLLWQAKGPPRFDEPYNHDQPLPECIYVLPDAPSMYQPEDWGQRVRDAGSVAFRATADRPQTLANLLQALQDHGRQDAANWFDLAPAQVAPFFGLGMGHLLLAALSEAMEHENMLQTEAFWDDVQQALATLGGLPYSPSTPAPSPPTYSTTGEYEEYLPPMEGTDHPGETEAFSSPPDEGESVAASAPQVEETGNSEASLAEANNTLPVEEPIGPPPEDNPDAWLDHLRRAAGRLLTAREVLYPVTIHLLDFWLVDGKQLDQPWPASFAQGLPLNLIASSAVLRQLAQQQPEQFDQLRQRLQSDQAEVCGGCQLEREDPLLPLDSQIWNLLKGQETARELLGADIHVYARKRFGFHPQLPMLLTTTGLNRALFLSFDDNGTLPTYQTCTVSWSSPDGKQVDAFARVPHPADSPNTFFNLGHFLFKTTREDHVATLAFLHKGQSASPWYADLLELSHLATVLGQWTTLSQYFYQVTAGEYPQPPTADDFHFDFLEERTKAQLSDPVSGFARHARLRRRLDTCWTLAALHRSLAGRNDTLDIANDLKKMEDLVEEGQPSELFADSLADLEKKIATTLTERLQGRAVADQPGYMILNPCGFIRRVALELSGSRPLPLGGPVKACQLDGEQLRAVVEVPALGFAWIPQAGPPGTPPPPMRMRLADQQTHCVRNEFFEAEIDTQTGGLKAIRDHKNYINRLGQRLVFNPGSHMQATSVKVASQGPALGEIISEGVLLGEQNQVLAKFRQRFRAWLGRPLLELRIELFPEQPPAGYPWHAYYGARFAWRDERAVLMRGVNGHHVLTTHNRPQTPDYLELRFARQSTVLLTGGLPFHQRQENRMVDVILVVEGEKATAFELGIGLDREMPFQTALGMATPVPVVPTSKGPPHIGAAGWLFHLDINNLLLSRLYPGGLEQFAEGRDLRDAVTARLLECSGHGGHAEFRCVRDPQRAVMLDARGQRLNEVSPGGDTVYFEVSPHDLVQLQVEFS